MKELYRFRQYLKENESEYSEENPMVFTLPQVDGDTGVKLPMRKIFKMLKDAGYNPEITSGNKVTGIKDITIGVGDDKFSAGQLTISKNGMTYGDDLWGKDIKSENEIFPLIDEYYNDQLEMEKSASSPPDLDNKNQLYDEGYDEAWSKIGAEKLAQDFKKEFPDKDTDKLEYWIEKYSNDNNISDFMSNDFFRYELRPAVMKLGYTNPEGVM